MNNNQASGSNNISEQP